MCECARARMSVRACEGHLDNYVGALVGVRGFKDVGVSVEGQDENSDYYTCAYFIYT